MTPFAKFHNIECEHLGSPIKGPVKSIIIGMPWLFLVEVGVV